MFHVEAKKEVSHTNRDVEFIGLRRQMEEWCRDALTRENLSRKTYTHSCEQIAQDLLMLFELSSCKVFEDNENGAEVER
jgi:hypothetical protein